MKKVVVFLFVFFNTNIFLFAQNSRRDDAGEYAHSFGVSYLSVNHKSKDFVIHSNYAALMYNFRIDYQFNAYSSVGVTSYPTIGYAVSTKVNPNNANTNRFAGSTVPSYCFDIPVLIQYNNGNHSTRLTKRSTGRFIGVGASYSYYTGSKIVLDAENRTTFLPASYVSLCAGAGLKFMIKKQSFGIRLSYSRPLLFPFKEAANNFGFSVLYNFGSHRRYA